MLAALGLAGGTGVGDDERGGHCAAPPGLAQHAVAPRPPGANSPPATGNASGLAAAATGASASAKHGTSPANGVNGSATGANAKHGTSPLYQPHPLGEASGLLSVNGASGAAGAASTKHGTSPLRQPHPLGEAGGLCFAAGAQPAAGATGAAAMWQQLIGEHSTAVGKLARVSAPKGVRLRTGPARGQPDLGVLPFDELVRVERRTEHGWCWLVPTGALSGQVGFCEEQYLAIDPPEPTAHLYRVAPGDRLANLARQHYGHSFGGGHNARLYVQAIVEANRGRRGVYFSDVHLSKRQTALRREDEEQTLQTYLAAKVRAGNALWMPSEAFIEQLRAAGAITSGSTELAKAWRGAKDVVAGAVDFATYGAAFTVGLLEGAWNALAELFEGAADMIELVAKTAFQLITGNLGAIKATLLGWVEKLKTAWQSRDKIADSFMRKWESDDAWTRGTFQGEVLGWVMMTALLIFATSGQAAALLATGKWATVLRVLRTVDALGDITTYVGKVARLPLRATSALRRKLGKGASDAAHVAEEALEAEGDAARAVERAEGDAAKAVERAEGAGSKASEKRPAVASGVEEPPDPLLRGGDLSPRQLDLDRRLEQAVDGIIEIGKREVTATDLAALTRRSGVEHAVVMLQDGKRRLVRLGSYKGGALPSNTKRLLMHSHPDDYGSGMAKFISEADVEAIVALGQKYSYMVTLDGTVYRFTTSTVPMSIGEVVRKFHPVLGWVGQ